MTAPVRTVTPADLTRLKADRDAADARYNAALTALDAAIQRLPPLPHPPPGPDEHQVTPLNQTWDVLAAAPPPGGGWRGRLARAVWQVIAPALGSQQRFNAALVDHVNRSVPRERAVTQAIDAVIGLVRAHIEETIRFQSQLVVYLQSLTPYVDTKDHEFAALARRTTEDVAVTAARLDEIARGLAGGLSGLADDMLKRVEAATVTSQRQGVAIDELRTALATVRQGTSALQRHVEQLGDVAPAIRPPATAPIAAAATTAPGGPQQMHAQDPLRSHQYAGFEDAYRGSEDDIRDRMRDYVRHFAGARDVVDVGCGRGEFLEMLAADGIPARGVDLNVEMVARCRAKGLDVVAADALAYLADLPDASLGGLIAAQVVEHLQPDDLMRLLELAARRLRPGAPIVLETINPACWSAFFDSYVRDLTHVRPVHPDTLRYLLIANGFVDAAIEWRSPYPDEGKLQRVGGSGGDTRLDGAIATVDRNTDRLNALMFGPRDYAAVARRG
ncbi:MAG: class I SAM-dependent methyltransferase [Vicinamibacterales bacterium]